METIQFSSQVGADGMLDIRVPVGLPRALQRVAVTASFPTEAPQQNFAADWERMVQATYGACAGLELEETPDEPWSERDERE